jgi:hypothetical protein
MLDRSRPFGEVHGLGGAVYEQDGQYFNAAGNPAVIRSIEDEPEIIPEDIFIPGPTCIEQATLPPEKENGRAIEDMSPSHLKALGEVYGEKWTNRNQVLKLTKGKK